MDSALAGQWGIMGTRNLDLESTADGCSLVHQRLNLPLLPPKHSPSAKLSGIVVRTSPTATHAL